MAETKTPTPKVEPTSTSTIVLDWAAARAHLQMVRDNMIEQYAGKDGMNPHLWLAKYHHPLEQEVAVGNTTAELYNRIFELKVTEPKIN